MSDAETPWALVGERVRAARARAGLTVRELARRTGLSASHVSQVERGLGAFSVPALYDVASELGVTLGDLLAPGQDAAVADAPPRDGVRDLVAAGIVQRAADHPTIRLSSGPTWSRLTAAGEPGAEFLEVVYAPGTPAPREHIHHAGREYGIVLSGVLDVEIAGATTRVHAGDSIAFDSTLPHRFWNAGADPVRAIWFVRDRDSADPLPHG